MHGLLLAAELTGTNLVDVRCGAASATSRGLAAEDAVLRLLAPGEAVLLSDDAYGGTFRLARQIHGAEGRVVVTADLTDIDAVRDGWNDATKLV